MVNVGIATLLWASLVGAASGNVSADLEKLAGVPDPEVRVRQIDTGVRSAFDAALLEYDAHVARNPHDVIVHLQRCRFMEEFAGTYEYVSFVDTLYALQQECMDAAAARFPEHPEIQLAELQRQFGTAQVEAADKLLRGELNHWTAGQLSRLYSVAASALDEDNPRVIELARKSLQADEASDVRLLLATRLAARGEKDEAARVLAAAVDGHPQNAWYLVSKMRLLADLGAREHVFRIHAELRGTKEEYDHLVAARALRQVGAVAQAREELRQLGDAKVSAPVAREWFRFEFDNGGGTDTLAAYNRWRDAGLMQDPLAINRVALLLHQPLLPWQARDLLGIGVLLLLVAAAAVLVALPIALVHYRGLARRVRTAEPYPQGGWTLGHAWFVLFVLAVTTIVPFYGVGPLDLVKDFNTGWRVDASLPQIARMAMLEAVLTLTLLLPLGFVAKRLQAEWWGAQWSIAKSLLLGAALGLTFRIPLLLVWFGVNRQAPASSNDLLWQVVGALRDQFGAASALWLLVIFAPVIEEFIFRGVLLRAFAAHLKFGWANVVQAALFASMHMNPSAWLGLFLLGLCAGTLARRSGGLLASMMLHAVFNLIGGLLMLF